MISLWNGAEGNIAKIISRVSNSSKRLSKKSPNNLEKLTLSYSNFDSFQLKSIILYK